jgi:L-asparagine oxygenase
MTTDRVLAYDLPATEVGELEELLADLVADRRDPGGAEFHDRAWEYSGRLPRGLRRFLADFRRDEPAAAFKICGLPVRSAEVGPTPRDWRAAAQSPSTLREELYLSLVGSVLGEIFSWSTLQAGRMVQNVMPIAGEEEEQSGHGSDVELEWHTEDGFHPCRCDYLALLGVRNEDRTATTVSSIRDAVLDPDCVRILFERRFHILPDNEHIRQLARNQPDHPGLLRMIEMRRDPENVAVLFGSPDLPYLRIDPYFMRCADGDAEAERALKTLIAELERTQQDVVVGPGTLLVIDNYLAVHGRKTFSARYDGTDRWLKKAIITRDLRKSRGLRETASARVLV